ncbi:hypothetical protein [Methylibium petroleiphilum]|uniref:Uncharacterized protein n=1 Tax=Methylibium petroleiphilum (strain ATCC BAA-1232 / LMG 22953 / PM1) TaxID=420662 RepID=A2SNE2_METPP|nr:hypothetical protein [Methylibium petroleiphilum]ABM97081.1 hypothetical protein Mpe_B0306 [Methylibium petroleiphilum PM1]
MGSIATELHDKSHEVDREPFEVIFSVRFRAGNGTKRDVKVPLTATYEELAWSPKDVSARARTLAAAQQQPGERLLVADYCLDALTSQSIERELEGQHGFRATPVPSLYNPVHSSFVRYREQWIDGQLVLAVQKSAFYRYCVVPQHLWSRATPGSIPVLVV